MKLRYTLLPMLIGFILTPIVYFVNLSGEPTVEWSVLVVLLEIVLISQCFVMQRLSLLEDNLEKVMENTIGLKPNVEILRESTRTVEADVNQIKKHAEWYTGKIDFIVAEIEYRNRLMRNFLDTETQQFLVENCRLRDENAQLRG